ncbi:glycosyltransferase, partial [Aeromonas caviae]|uniref:glycosyltransferase family 2 protein n=1 Tax=Aeromonas caviae TaxID=648 RepID=UPI00214EE3F8
MDTAPKYYTKIKALNCCVIIPTYNNDKTLQRVVSGVLDYTDNVIVVNDGATDATPQILANYPQITVINHETNKGKGIALQTGFKAALAM